MNRHRSERGALRASKVAVLVGFVLVGLLLLAPTSWFGASESAGAQVASEAPAPPAEPQTTPAPAPSDAPASQTAGAPDQQAQSDPAAKLFLQKCAGCHTVGRGRLSGPDLNASATWQTEDLARAIKAMESKAGPLPDTEIAQLTELLKAADVKERLAAEQERTSRLLVAKLEPASAPAGERLFFGSEPFENGGTACVACHAVAGTGGTLGPDLTGVYTKLGEAPLTSATEKSTFKVMSAAYRDHPVTTQEAVHLTKFFSTFDPNAARPPSSRVPLFGALGAVALLGLLAVAYRRRPVSIRKQLVRRQNDGVD